MRKLVLASLLLNIVLSSQLAWQALTASAAGGGGSPPIGNGDVNGDGAYSLTDAVYILRWLFQGESAPVPIETTGPGEVAALPATGQTQCYDPGSGVEIPCRAGFPCGSQDGAYQAGCPREGRFVDKGDGTVTDLCTGLQWQKSPADVNSDGRLDDEDTHGWCEALAYCDLLTLAGHEDWRLPNVVELMSLVDYGRTFPAIDPVFEVTTGQINFYSCSTVLRGGPGPGQFFVDFGVGMVGGGGGASAHTRAVRTTNPR